MQYDTLYKTGSEKGQDYLFLMGKMNGSLTADLIEKSYILDMSYNGSN